MKKIVVHGFSCACHSTVINAKIKIKWFITNFLANMKRCFHPMGQLRLIFTFLLPETYPGQWRPVEGAGYQK